MAKRSILVASIFGLFSTIYVAYNGHASAVVSGELQPMKMAAYEGLWDGQEAAGLVAVGMVNSSKQPGDDADPFHFKIEIPGGLSLLANHKVDTFVPGINDLVYGNEEQGIEGIDSKIVKGREAVADFASYKEATKANDEAAAQAALARFNVNQEYLGFGYLNSPEQAVPPVATTFYAFHIMIALGGFFGLLFVAYLFYVVKGNVEEKRWLLPLGVASFFLGIIATQAGWLVAEVGRQPWAIQDLLPIQVATSNIGAGSVMTTFFVFAVIFTVLLFAEIKIMLAQIKKGPEGA